MLEPTQIERVLRVACRAPSVHNTQPWTWKLHDDGHVDLYADFTRQLIHADPQGRDLLISCGAALHHLQVAARALGWSARVRRTPDPTNKSLIASVQLTPDRLPPDADELLDAIGKRRTDRRRFTSWPVPTDRLHELCMVGNQWGAQVLPVYEDATKANLERLTRRADEIQKRDPGYVSELAAWTTYWKDQGVPVGHVPRRAGHQSTDVLNQRFGHGLMDDPQSDPGPPADGMLLICTSSDDTLSRIRAGEALSAVWLQATRDHLSMVPLSQALEVEETQQTLQDEILGGLAIPQLIVRVGWLPMERDELGPTPRRDLREIVLRP